MITLPTLDQYFAPAQSLPAGTEHRPGVLFGVPDSVYHQTFRALSSSLLKEPTAAEMWYSMNEPPSEHWETEYQAVQWTVGTLVHWAVLEPWKFQQPDKYIALSPTKGLATQKAQAVRAEAPHLLLVTPELVEQAHECVAAVAAHPFAQQLLNVPAGREVSLFHFDKRDEVWIKARFDFLPTPGNYLLDVKTTSFPPPQFPKEVRKLGYHIQAAHYLDTWEAITGERKEIFYFAAVNKSAPFMCKVFDIQNYPKGHILYDDKHPLKQAREILAARKATWITAAHETQTALGAGMRLSAALTRSLWPAYEGDQPASTPIMFSY